MLELLLAEAAVEAAAFNSSEHPVKVKEELMASCCFPSVEPAALAQALSLHSLLTKPLRVAHSVAVVLPYGSSAFLISRLRSFGVRIRLLA